PVDDPGRCAGETERQRHAHQHLVAIEFGWVVGSTDPRARPFLFLRQETCCRRSVPMPRDFGPFCVVFGSRKPERQCPELVSVIKIVMIQWSFKFSLSIK